METNTLTKHSNGYDIFTSNLQNMESIKGKGMYTLDYYSNLRSLLITIINYKIYNVDAVFTSREPIYEISKYTLDKLHTI